MHLVLGPNFEDKIVYFNEFKSSFNKALNDFKNFFNTYSSANIKPKSCNRCKHCKWIPHCKQYWKDNNSLEGIAGIRKTDISKLESFNIKTIRMLSQSDFNSNIDIKEYIFKRLKEQARLQQLKLDDEAKGVDFSTINKNKYVFCCLA